MSHIRYLISNFIAEQLATDLITNIDPDDLARATLVKYGRFQSDPILNHIYVSVSGGNLQQPTQVDGLVSLEEMKNIGLNFPVREIGGGTFWWRRGWLEISCMFITQGYTEIVAADEGHILLGRVEKSLDNMNICGLTDEFGEKAIKLFLVSDNFTEGGGPPTQYLWRGQVMWQVLTQRVI